MIIIDNQLYFIEWYIDDVFCLWNGTEFSVLNLSGPDCTPFFKLICPD